MIEYGKYHFPFEEKFMEEIGFAEVKDHKKKHKDFVQKMDHIALQMHQGDNVLNSEILKVIENWILDHILKEDQKFIEHFVRSEQGAETMTRLKT
ncbi:MAG: hemerythrin family protein [Deltaproteobacteria bacterium]|nr:hemerythrin family protein [Candidatus Desulfobacula maris]